MRVITEAAIAAAAEAIYTYEEGGPRSPYYEHAVPWTEVQDRRSWLSEGEAAIEAALPHLKEERDA